MKIFAVEIANKESANEPAPRSAATEIPGRPETEESSEENDRDSAGAPMTTAVAIPSERKRRRSSIQNDVGAQRRTSPAKG